MMVVSPAKEPTDSYAIATDSFDRTEARVMPPSPGVESLWVEYEEDAGVGYYQADVEWRPEAYGMLKSLPDWQKYHRSRELALSVSRGRIREINKRLGQAVAHHNDYDVAALNDEESEALYNILIDKTRAHIRFSRKYIDKYVKEHAGSSTGRDVTTNRGRRWEELLEEDGERWSNSQWREIMDDVLSLLDWLQENPAGYLRIDWFFGQRARSPPLRSLKTHYENEVDRTRLIVFHTLLSIWNVFIPDKNAWYGDCLKAAYDYLGCSFKYYTPLVDKGHVFVAAAELFNDQGDKFQAYDGKSWDTGVGLILGKAFAPLLTYFKGIAMLGSGIAWTSLLGTIVMFIVLRHTSGIMVLLGDDANIFNGKNIPKAYYLEYQPDDTTYRYILGVSYYVDPFAPRLCGIRVTMDHAGRDVSVTSPNFNGKVKYTHDDRTVYLWLQMYEGFYGDNTLYDAIKKAEVEDYFAPKKYLEERVAKADAGTLSAAREHVKGRSF
jgi:hypothetical protein